MLETVIFSSLQDAEEWRKNHEGKFQIYPIFVENGWGYEYCPIRKIGEEDKTEIQDAIDNAIFRLFNEIAESINVPTRIAWDIEEISGVRESIWRHVFKKLGVSEEDFYPYVEEGEE